MGVVPRRAASKAPAAMRMPTRIRWQINLVIVAPDKNLGISTQEQFRGRSHCRGDVSGFLASIIAFPYLGRGCSRLAPPRRFGIDDARRRLALRRGDPRRRPMAG